MSARKTRIARAFDRADAYDAHARIQRVAADRLAAAIARTGIDPARPALEIGCGTGFLTAALLDALPGLALEASDIAPAMLDRARARLGPRPGLAFSLRDGEHPGEAPTGGWGLIASNLALQWFEDPLAAIGRLASRLAPGGLLAVTTLCDGSFSEWRRALSGAGLGGIVRDWPAPATLAAAAPGDCAVAIDTYPLVETHPSGRDFLRGLKAIGAATPWTGSAAPAGLRHAIAAFEAGGARITYRVAELLVRHI